MALAAVHSKAVVLLLLIRDWILLPMWDSVIVLCFVVPYFCIDYLCKICKLSSESASRSNITPCVEIDKPLVNYLFYLC